MLVAILLACALASGAPEAPGQVEAGAAAPAVQPPSAQPVPSVSAPATLKLAAGTVVEVELVDKLSSSTNQLADRFAIRLVAPIARDGVTLVSAGAAGQGEVIDVARAGMGGKQGKLIVSARYLDLNGRRVRVRGMILMASGKSRVDLATGVLLVPYAGVAAVFVQGGEIEIPAGARATVKLAEDVDLPVELPVKPTGDL